MVLATTSIARRASSGDKLAGRTRARGGSVLFGTVPLWCRVERNEGTSSSAGRRSRAIRRGGRAGDIEAVDKIGLGAVSAAAAVSRSMITAGAADAARAFDQARRRSRW